MKKKWILIIELITEPGITKKHLTDQEMLQSAFDSQTLGGPNILVVQAGAMQQQAVKE